MKSLIHELLNIIKIEIENAGYDKALATVNISKRSDLCEYQCNSAFALAKLKKERPMDVAMKIAENMKKNMTLKNVVAVNPGFINFDVSDVFLANYLEKMYNMQNFGLNDGTYNDTIIIDYGGPNVAKALHIGHLRSAIIGESLKRIAKILGNKVIADVHLGDYGLQMGLIITELSIKKPNLPYFRDDFNEDTYFEQIKEAPFTIEELGQIYPEASKKSKEDVAYYEKALKATKLLQEGNRAYMAIFKHIINVSVSDLKKSYDRLDVSFDLWLGESDAKPYIKDMIEKMKKDGFARVDNNALVIDVSKDTDKKEIPPCLIQKSDGSSLYATTDLATLVQRKKDFDPNRIIYVVDKRQEMHFTQVFRVAKKCKILDDDVKLDFVGFGTICGDDAKPLKSRDGGVVTLKSLLDETVNVMKEKIIKNEEFSLKEANEIAEMIAIAAIKYADLSNQPSKDYIFDSSKFTSYEGNTGPYILYSLVRINSILDKCKNDIIDNDEFVLNKEMLPPEKDLMCILANYIDVVNKAFLELSPNKICAFLYDISNSFNKFYHDIKVLSQEDELKKKSYICLLRITKDILTHALDLLAIKAPNRM